jgi:hypothetical protein
LEVIDLKLVERSRLFSNKVKLVMTIRSKIEQVLVLLNNSAFYHFKKKFLFTKSLYFIRVDRMSLLLQSDNFLSVHSLFIVDILKLDWNKSVTLIEKPSNLLTVVCLDNLFLFALTTAQFAI